MPQTSEPPPRYATAPTMLCSHLPTAPLVHPHPVTYSATRLHEQFQSSACNDCLPLVVFLVPAEATRVAGTYLIQHTTIIFIALRVDDEVLLCHSLDSNSPS